MQTTTHVIGCKVDRMPSTFLGLPIGVNIRSKRTWNILVDKYKKKLSRWKIKTISIGRRHTSVCNVLGNLGTFLFSLFKDPKGVIKKLENLRKEFFFGGRKPNYDENLMGEMAKSFNGKRERRSKY